MAFFERYTMIENFASNLWRLRQEKEVSQKELAQEIGVTA